MSLKALPFVALNGFLFGSTLVASRFSVGQYAPLTYIALRLVIASSAHLLIYALTTRAFPRNRRLWFHAAMLGVFGTAVNLVCIVSSLQYQSSGLTSILITTSPAVTTFIAALVLPKERINALQWLGIGISLAGAILLTVSGQNGLPDVPTDPRGYLLVGIAVISGSVMTVYTRVYLAQEDSIDTASIRMFTAALVVIPLSLLLDGFDMSGVDVMGYGALLWAALVGTFAGFLTQVTIVQRFGAISAALVPYVLPVFATLGGVLLLGETVTGLMIVGILIILSGIALVQQPALKAAFFTPNLEIGAD